MKENVKNAGLILALIIAGVSLPTSIMSFTNKPTPITEIHNYYYNTTIIEQYNTTIIEQYNTTIIEQYNTTILVPLNRSLNPTIETINYNEFDYVIYSYNFTYNDFFWYSWNYTKLTGGYAFEMWFIVLLDSQLSYFETQWGLGNYGVATDSSFYSTKDISQDLYRIYFNDTIHFIFANQQIFGYTPPKPLTIAREVINI